MISGRVLITGGTGTLGRAIVKRAQLERWPASFTIMSRDEVKQSEMKARYPECNYVLGNVSDLDWLRTRVRGHDCIIHAAAYKQVPSAEFNAREAVYANVVGSTNIAQAAVEAGVARVVGISTDKACAPVNAYGATKMIMERTFQEAATWGDTVFTLCRYGNVVGSRGSVVPLFREQHEKHGVMTVTDARMTRFWLNTDEAINLIIDAAHCTVNGVIVVPKALASKVISIARAVCSEHCQIEEIGIRPGEKLHESLIHKGESQHTELYDRTFYVYPATSDIKGNLPDQFEYTSDIAQQLSFDGLTEAVRV